MNKKNVMEKFREHGIVPKAKLERRNKAATYREIAEIIIREAYGDDYTDQLGLGDLEKLIKHKTEGRKIADSKTIKTVNKEIRALSSKINRYEAGDKGEEKARKALMLFYKEHCKLHNVFLENEYGSAEYDDIVISPRGIFIIEVKNINNDVYIRENGDFYKRSREKDPVLLGNIAESMERKRYILWRSLTDEMRDELYINDIHLTLLFVGRGVVENKCCWLDVRYCGDICRYIEEYPIENRRIFIEDMERIYRHLESVRKPHLWELDVDIERMAEDLESAFELINGKQYGLITLKRKNVLRFNKMFNAELISAKLTEFKLCSHEKAYIFISPFIIVSSSIKRAYKNARHI